ncbi:DNA mismatch repair protein MutS domain protein [Paludibacter propionicigenes WB4]|uniref:DNA mismatch repair protein MutS domain protein n=1 Tax=Paludibacter propionicigenes (strain DSM 17365 / JCM 13257 / WB4) TaxID=694427 RepID=E4T0Q5_PALPW|nr:DNA mismatch repair protein MutS domain-containing protein [Paludibacter propionicigenes]ADQ81119.1 DNA mismatch repair protein MutS domain protein [Paludibacter propionicigenes WB4]
MTSCSPIAYYQNRITTLEDEYKRLKKRSRMYSLVRFCLFTSFAGSLYLLFKTDYIVLPLIVAIVSLSFFVLYIVRYNRLEGTIARLSSKIQINRDELLYLDYNFSDRNAGEKYATLNPSLSADFDLFGKGSLYQYISRCYTQKGSDILAQKLSNPDKDPELIKEKQGAIHELCENNEFVQNFLSISRFIQGDVTESVLQGWMDETAKDFTAIRIVAIVLGAVNIVCTLLSAFADVPWTLPGLTVTISLAFVTFHSKKILKIHSQLISIANHLENYIAAFALTEEQSFQSAHLQSLKKSLTLNDSTASQTLGALHRILAVFEIRQNKLLSFLLNAFILFDIHLFYSFSHWKLRFNSNTSVWFGAFHEMETLISFATFAFNNAEHVAYPAISSDGFCVEAQEMGHPLLNQRVRVNNTFSMSGMPSVLIITGANMAGKSTFLRTVGVNLILGMNGAPVVAESFTFTPCDIFSCLKIQDSLINNESYFYAELLRLKEIIEHTQKHPKTLVILDEILRGTNTKDKQTGSLGFLEKLIHLNVPVIVATHDLIIGDLEQKYPGIAVNRCFEVELVDDQLYFDYKLKKGVSQKLNASFLLKKMEIID